MDRQRPPSRSPRSCSTNSPRSTAVGETYIVGGSPNEIRVEPDPEKLALYGVTLEQLDRKADQRQPRLSRRRICATTDTRSRSSPARRCRAFPTSACCCSRRATAARSMSRTSPMSVVGSAELDHRAWTMTRDADGGLDKRPGGQPRHRQAQGRQRGRRRARDPRPARNREGPHRSGRPRSHGDAQLRRDRERQGERASVPSRARHRLDRRADHR